jgi:hypothetical protein
MIAQDSTGRRRDIAHRLARERAYVAVHYHRDVERGARSRVDKQVLTILC